MEPFAPLPQGERRFPPRALSDLLAQSRARFLPWDGIPVERGRPTAAFGRRPAMAWALLHLVAEELKALADRDHPRFLRMQPHAQGLLEKSLGGGQGALGLCSGAAQPDKVVGPARQTKARQGHLTIKWREEDMGPQRPGHPTLRHPRPRGLPTRAVPHTCPQDIPA